MSLYSQNTFQRFWGLPADFPVPFEALQEQASRLFPGLPGACQAGWESLAALVLGEGQFGPEHFRLKGIRQLYYRMRPYIPVEARPLLHKIAGRSLEKKKALQWPVEDRFVRFLSKLMQVSLLNQQKTLLEYVHFWPGRKRFAFVITHDVESKTGQEFAWQLAELDKKYGFRSSFNFVPNEYKVDTTLLEQLMQNGFEVGVHGLEHDGRLFSSRAEFIKKARLINRFIHETGAVGFRSPLTHRNPEWMQALEIEYDSSFFDTDPFEPIPGGTLSIWPFQMGRFVELPYTLAQDHTLLNTLGEKTPRLWLEKVDFIRKHCGMALVNAHPDYLRNPAYFAIYEDFLGQMCRQDDYWQALPREAARWWKQRAGLELPLSKERLQAALPGATIGAIHLRKDSPGIELYLEDCQC